MTKKLSYEFVKQHVEQRGMDVLLSKEYKNNRSKLQFQCKKDKHVYEMTWGNYHRGQRCPMCAGNMKLLYEKVKEHVEQKGLDVLLSKKYKNTGSKLQFQCKKDKHVYEMTLDNYQQGKRCPMCAGNMKLLYEQIKYRVDQRGLDILLSKEYKNAHTKLQFQCKKDKHVYEMKWNNYQQDQRCPVCFYNSKSSKAEQEIQEYVACIYTGNIVNNDRNTILNENTGCYLELDVYLPEINKAIEYNGVYWHNRPYQKANDKIKQKQCKNKNINLLIINEEKYIENKDKCLKKIEKFINN